MGEPRGAQIIFIPSWGANTEGPIQIYLTQWKNTVKKKVKSGGRPSMVQKFRGSRSERKCTKTVVFSESS